MKHKCEHSECGKSIKLIETLTNKCKCGMTFCSKHKTPETHSCGYDYRAAAAAEIMKNGCPPSKITQI